MPTVRPVGTQPGDKIAATPPATIVSRGIVLKDSCSMAPSPQKVTFREMGVRGVLIYCRHRCGHHTKANADGWADDVRLSDMEPKFICTACGRRGADVRPKFEQPGWGRVNP